MAWLKNPPKIYFVILNTVIDDLNKSGLKNAFIVSGIVEKSIVFNDIPPNPTKDCIMEGVEHIKANKPDHIIAIGMYMHTYIFSAVCN